MLSKGAGEKNEREREREADRVYERGLRAHFGGRCGRFDFSHSLPLPRAHTGVRARRVMFTSANNGGAAIFCYRFLSTFFPQRSLSHTRTTSMISSFGNRACTCISLNVGVCTREYTYGQYAYLRAIVTQLANAH